MCLLAISIASLEKCLLRSSACFLIEFGFLLSVCMGCLYILEMKPLLVPSFAGVFSQSVGCLVVVVVSGFLCCIEAYKFD